MNLTEMRERFNVVSTKLSDLAQLPERTAEQEAEFDVVIAEFNDLGPKVKREIQIKNAAQEAAVMSGSMGRIGGIVANDGAPERQNAQRPDRRSIGERFAASDEVKNWLSTGGKSSAKVSLQQPKEGAYAVEYDGSGPTERHALIQTGVLPGYMIPDMVLPTIYRPLDQSLNMRSVLINGRTTSDTIYFLRELLFTNAAVEVAQATATAGASGLKPESSLTFEQASAPVVTIAHWIPITRQAIADAAQLQSYVEGRLMVGLDRRLNGQILNGAGGGVNMTGILATAGIQVADAAYFTANPVNDATTDNENFNRILRAKTLVDTVGDAVATFVVLNPTDIEAFQTRTDADRQYLGGGPFVAGGVPLLWGLPVVSERSVVAGTALVGDGTMAAVWDREDANILIDTVNDQFIRNMLTILAELRAALTVFRPAAFVDVDLAAWA